MKNEDIRKLIPQRDPIMMVDKLISVDGNVAITSLCIRAENYFIDEDGRLAEAGLIEHIAQAASAFAGYRAMTEGAIIPPLGLIGEVKKFHCYHRPNIADELRTTITIQTEIAGMVIITGETHILDEIIADTQIKIFMK